MLDLCSIQAVLGGLEMILTQSGIKARGFQLPFFQALTFSHSASRWHTDIWGSTWYPTCRNLQADGTTRLLEKVLEVLLERRGHTYLCPLFRTWDIHIIFRWLVPITALRPWQHSWCQQDTVQLPSSTLFDCWGTSSGLRMIFKSEKRGWERQIIHPFSPWSVFSSLLLLGEFKH